MEQCQCWIRPELTTREIPLKTASCNHLSSFPSIRERKKKLSQQTNNEQLSDYLQVKQMGCSERLYNLEILKRWQPISSAPPALWGGLIGIQSLNFSEVKKRNEGKANICCYRSHSAYMTFFCASSHFWINLTWDCVAHKPNFLNKWSVKESWRLKRWIDIRRCSQLLTPVSVWETFTWFPCSCRC